MPEKTKKRTHGGRALEKLAGMGRDVVADIERAQPPKLKIPSRSTSNILYDNKHRYFVLGSRYGVRSAASMKQVKKFAQLLCTADFAKELIESGKFATLREMYYTSEGWDAGPFHDQGESDMIIEDLEAAFGLKREDLGLTPEEDGAAVYGQLLVQEGDVTIDATKAGRSVDYSEPIVVREKGSFGIYPIGEIVDEILSGERKAETIEVAICDLTDFKIRFRQLTRAIRHKNEGHLLEFLTKSGRKIKVTSDHSLFVFKNGKIVNLPSGEIKIGDHLVIPKALPNGHEVRDLNFIEKILALPEKEIKDIRVQGLAGKFGDQVPSRYRHWRYRDNIPLVFLKSRCIDVSDQVTFKKGNSRVRIPAVAKLTKEFCRLLGYYAAEGCVVHEKSGSHPASYVCLAFGEHEPERIEDAKKCIHAVFGDLHIRKNRDLAKSSVTLRFGGKTLAFLFEKVLESGKDAYTKRVPEIIFNATHDGKIEFIRGYLCDAHVRREKIEFKSVSEELISNLCYLLLQLGITSSIVEENMQHKNRAKAYKARIMGRENLSRILNTLQDEDKKKVEEYISMISRSPTYPPNAIPLKESKLADIWSKTNPTLRRCDKKIKNIVWPYIRNVGNLSYINPGLMGEAVQHILNTGRGGVDEVYEDIMILEKIRGGQIAFDPVKEIRKVAPTNGYVYDFSVDGYENFIGGRGGILLHNSGYTIPPTIDDVEFIKCKAKRIIAVETMGMYHRLIQEEAWKKFNALIVGLKGQAARATRRFLKRAHDELGLPVYLNCDGDPFGFHIAMVIISGSAKLAYINHELAVPDAKYIGVSASDIVNYKLPTDKLRELDIARLKQLQKDPRYNTEFWQSEIKKMLEIGKKAEQQAFAKYGLAYVVKEYLPAKLKEAEGEKFLGK